MKRFNLKLSHKVFLAMVLSAVVTLVGVQCTAQYLIHSHSRAQFGQRFFSRMIRFSSALEAVYASQGKWGTLEQPENWERFVSVTFPQTDLYRNVLSESQRYIFPSVMALLETDGNHLAGSAGMKEEYLCTPLYFQDEVVGYLGLRAFSVLFDLVEYDGSSDLWILLSVGIGILVISLVASYFLSRHLLVPLEELTRGARAIADMNLSVRTQVKGGGELGALLHDFNAMAEQLERAKSLQVQWLTDISHELRTPLAIIRGELEAMQDGVRPMTPQALDSLHGEVVRLVGLVNDLHALSMADCDTQGLSRERVEPVSVLNSVLDMYGPAFERKGVRIYRNFSKDPLPIVGSRKALAQLFNNLLDNALAYGNPGGVLRLKACAESDALEVCIEDDGPGVLDEDLPRLFDRLFRADRARSRETGGSGLGLAICRAIAQAHGGDMVAKHGEKGGLAIVVGFPLVQSQR